MNKCQLCQQLNNNLTTFFTNRTTTFAEIILKFKGYKDYLDINNPLSICEKCKEDIESLTKFWERIPEAKPEHFLNTEEKKYERNDEIIFGADPSIAFSSNITTKAITNQSQELHLNRKHGASCKPAKRMIKFSHTRKNCTTVSTKNANTLEESPIPKRIRRPPKRYDDYNIPLPLQSVKMLSNNSQITKSSNSLLTKLPHMAVIRLTNGHVIGKLMEVENCGHSSKMRIICEICSNTFRFEKEFQKHLTVHKETDSFATDESYTSHSLSEKYLFYCALCDKSFQGHYSVRRHYKFSHSDDRPLKCEHCEANFKYKFNLDYHMAKHIPKKRFECVYCKKLFLMRYELQIHIRTHTKERPYKCQFCSFAFAHRTNLKTHQKIKHFKEISQDFTNTKNVEPNIENYSEHLQESVQSTVEQKNTQNIFRTSFSDYSDITTNTLRATSNVTSEYKQNVLESSAESMEYSNENILNDMNKMIVKAKRKNDISKLLNIQAEYKCFKIGSTSLKLVLKSPLLEMKKWQRSYQSKTQNVNSSILSNCNLRGLEYTAKSEKIDKEESDQYKNRNISNTNTENHNSVTKENSMHSLPENNSIKNMKITSETAEDSCETIKTEFDYNKSVNTSSNVSRKDSCEIINTEFDYNKSVNTSSNVSRKDSCEIINTEFDHNKSVNTSSNVSRLFQPNPNSTESSKYLLSNMSPKNGDFHKFSNSSSMLSSQNFRDIKIVKNLTSKKEVLNLSAYSNLNCYTDGDCDSHTKSKSKTRSNPKYSKKFKVSSRPVKIIKLNKYIKFSEVNSTITNPPTKTDSLKDGKCPTTKSPKSEALEINSKHSSILIPPVRNERIKNTEVLPVNRAIASLTEDTSSNSPISPIKSTTNSSTVETILSAKPLITKIEILPKLTTLPTSQDTYVPLTVQNLIKIPTEYKYQCPHCFKYFKQKSSLTKHLRTHTGEKIYKCNLCPKSYADASNYKKHKILHKNAAEALNLSKTPASAVQYSPAYSTVSDPDPDGIEVMQTITKFDSTDDDDISLTSSNMESYMWHDALDHALKSDEIRENIRKNLAGLNNAIMPESTQQHFANKHSNLLKISKSFSCELQDWDKM